MRISSLVFNYDKISAKNTAGRSGIVDTLTCDFIFSYSSASVASFLIHNSNLEFIVNTDNVDLFTTKIKEYDVPLDNLRVVDWSDKINEWKNHHILVFHLRLNSEEAKINKESFLKLDNDLICKRSVDDIFGSYDCIIWDYIGRTNNMISAGRDYWGEKLCAMEVVGTDNFMGYNIGVLGYAYNKLDCVRESFDLGIKMANVDVSSATINHGGEERGKKILAWAEQLASNYVVHKHKLNIRLVSEYFDHHYSNKQLCIDKMSHLRKI